MSEAELYATLLLINHIISEDVQNLAISEITIRKNTANSYEEVLLGFGISPLHKLINNSCDPNVNDLGLKREHVLFSLRPIKTDEQVS